MENLIFIITTHINKTTTIMNKIVVVNFLKLPLIYANGNQQ